MKRNTFKYSILVSVLTVLIQATPTFASPIDSPVTQGQINATQGQIDNLETKIQQLDNQIIIGMDKSQKLDDGIKARQGQIEGTKAEIEKAKKDLDTRKQLYSARLRNIQAQGQPSIITYSEILLSSKDVSEFLTRSTAIMDILQSDSDIMTTLNEKEQTLKDAEQQLHNELDTLKKSQDELASEQTKINVDKQEVEKELADSKNTLQQQRGQLTQQQAEQLAKQKAEQLAQQLAQQQAQQSSRNSISRSTSSNDGNTVSFSTSASASQVIAYAEQFLGVPYVWGGTSPSGFDCSGFMQYAFLHSAGIHLPRVSQEQQNVGTRISPNDVQAGDLVFMGDPAYHVGMYIGNGQWIEAPETGEVIKIANYNPAHFSSAARILR